MTDGNFPARSLLLNAGIVLAGLGLVLIRSTRHAHWGPEGPVGGWLLLIPYVVIAAAVTAALIARGAFSWVPGDRLTCTVFWLGLFVAFAVSGWYSMSDPKTKFEQFAAVSGWLLLAGCLVAANAGPSNTAKAIIIATLGLGGAAGWLQVGAWLVDHAAEQNQLAESRIESERKYQDSRDAEFRALGKDAPLWNYLGYMYISNEELRKECLAIIAARPDRDARLAEYLGNEMLAPGATRYIGEFHPAPGAALAPAFARRSDLFLAGISESETGSNPLSDRSYDDVRDILRAATRIRQGGGDLGAQMDAWRNYLKRFKNTGELVTQIDQALAQGKTR